GWRFDSRATIFAEDRKNGTPLQVNDTNASQISGEVGGEVAGGFLSTRVFRIGQTHDQTFSVISTEPPRASEELDRIDRVPTNVVRVTTPCTNTGHDSTP